MGEIVAALATTHAPQLLIRPKETEDAEEVARTHAAMRRLGERLDASSADVIVIFGIDHLENYLDHVVAPFIVYTGDEVGGDFGFDRSLRASLERGDGRRLVDMTPGQLDAAGNVELRTWTVVMGAVGADRRATVLHYEPCWHHGHGVLYWDLAPATAAARS